MFTRINRNPLLFIFYVLPYRGFLAKHTMLLLALTTSAFFIMTSLTTLLAYLYFAPSLRLSDAPQPSTTTEYKVIKNEGQDDNEGGFLDGPGDLPRIKEEEEEGTEGGLYTDEEDDEATVMRSQASDSQSPLSVTTEDDDEGEGSGSEVNVSVRDALH